VNLIVFRIEPGNVALRQVSWRAEWMAVGQRGKVERLDISVEDFDHSVSFGMIMYG
jgi:hypothetical protein